MCRNIPVSTGHMYNKIVYKLAEEYCSIPLIKSFNGEHQQYLVVPVCWKIHMSNTYVCASTSIYGFMTDSVLLPAVC